MTAEVKTRRCSKSTLPRGMRTALLGALIFSAIPFGLRAGPVPNQNVIVDLSTSPNAIGHDVFVVDSIFAGSPVAPSDQIARATFQLLSAPTSSAPAAIQFPTCTAVLIDIDILLTAGHCVADPDRRLTLSYRLSDGTTAQIKINQIERHPGFFSVQDASGAHVRNDLALLRLASPIPGAKAVALVSPMDQLPDSFQVISAGFGKNGHDITESEMMQNPDVAVLIAKMKAKKKPSPQDLLDFKSRLSALAAAKPLLVAELEANLKPVENPGEPSMVLRGANLICNGDSGGPSFVVQHDGLHDGQLLLVGIHSTTTDNECHGPSILGKFISFDRAYDTYLGEHLQWIKATLLKMKAQENL